MSIIECHECKAKISEEVNECPQCGAKVKHPPGRLKILIIGLLCIFVVKAVWDSNATPSSVQKSPEEIAATARKEARFQSVVSSVQALKASTKNPDSFKIVSVADVGNEVLCITYRGTNSFNAVVTEQKAIRAFQVVNWNKECAGKSGENFDNVQYAL
jgi:hypothetical protein